MIRRVLAGVAALLAARLLLECTAFHDTDTAPVDGGAADQAAEPPSDGPTASTCRGEPASYATLDGGAAFDTCDGTPNVDLLRSSEHCGRCDHRCRVPGCQGGVCTPERFPVTDTARVAGAYGTDIYFTNTNGFNGLGVFHLDGGGTELLTNDPETSRGLVRSDGTSRYLRTDRGIYIIAGGGLYPIITTTSAPDTWSFASLGDQIVFNRVDGVYVVPAQPGSTPTLLAAGHAGDVAVAHSETYWFDEAWRVNLDAGTVLSRTDGGLSFLVATDPGTATTLTIDDDMAYYFRPAVVDPTDASAGVRQTLVGVRLDGDGGPEVLDDAVVPNVGDPFPLVVNADSLFWLRRVEGNAQHVVMKRAKCGGASVPITAPFYTTNPNLVAAGDFLVVPSGSDLLVISP